jgi:hypothetical protein
VAPTPEGKPAARYRLPLLVVAFVIFLTSCTAANTDGSSPATEAAPSPSPSPSQFVSERHSYHLHLPAGWQVTEYEGTWTSLTQFSPGAEVPGEDVVSPPTGPGFLVANSMRIPTGVTPDGWLADLDRLVGSGPDPTCRESTDIDVVADVQTTTTTHECADVTIVGRSLTHNGRGYYFTIGFPPGDITTQAMLDDIVSSIGFTDQ